MPINDIVIAPGTLVKANIGSGGSFVAFFEVVSIDDLGKEMIARIKATHLGSSRRKRVPGLPGYEDLKLKGHYTRAGEQNARKLAGVYPGKEFQVELSNGDLFHVTDGWLCDHGVSVPDPEGDDPDLMEITICVNDATFTAGSP